MTDRQYLRKVSLVVGAGDTGIDLSELRIKFEIKQAVLQMPNNITIRVFNLSDDTAQRIQKEFTRVILQAGYLTGSYGVVFDGTIVQVKRGRENATDTYTDIAAAEGDAAYCFSVVNTSLRAGSSFSDRIVALQKAMAPLGTTQGYVPDNLPGTVLPRGRVLYGMVRDHLRTIAKSTDTEWSIQGTDLTVIPKDDVVPGQVTVLNSFSGMIGLPEQTEGGIKVRCLLNPKIKPGSLIQIDNKSIQQASLSLEQSEAAAKRNGFLPRVADDGFYKAYVVEHQGDTRGNDWFTDIIAIALGDQITPSLVRRIQPNG